MSKMLLALLFNVAGMVFVFEAQIEHYDPECPYCESYKDCQGDITGHIWDCTCKETGKEIFFDPLSGKRCAKQINKKAATFILYPFTE